MWSTARILEASTQSGRNFSRLQKITIFAIFLDIDAFPLILHYAATLHLFDSIDRIMTLLITCIHSLLLYREDAIVPLPTHLRRFSISDPRSYSLRITIGVNMCLLIADPKRAKRRLRRFASFGSASTAKHPRPQAQLSNIADDRRSAGNAWWHAPRTTVLRR